VQALDIGQGGGAGVQAADGSRLGVDERLDAKADAVHAAAKQCVEHGVAERGGRALDRYFSVWDDDEGLAQGGENALQLPGFEQGWGPAAQVYGIDLKRKPPASFVGGPLSATHVGTDSLYVTFVNCLAKNT
jgi:hypothetical protein